jgi:hypothetical protein
VNPPNTQSIEHRNHRTAVARLLTVAVLAATLAGVLAFPETSQAGGLIHGIRAYYPLWEGHIHVYGDGFTPGGDVEVDIAVENGDGIVSVWRITRASGPDGVINVDFGPYCPRHVWVKAVDDKTGWAAAYDFVSYDCPW